MKTNIKVAGTTFHPLPKQAKIAITQEFIENNVPCAVTDAILQPEPTNIYDSEAVMVYVKLTDGSAFHLGYVPKDEPMKKQIKNTTLASVMIKDYRQQGDFNLSYVITEIK